MADKLGADAFLYLSPEQGIDDFAQCSECRDWIPGDNRCFIHGRHVEVLGTMSCGFYVYGEPLEPGDVPYAMVSPMESGLVNREVRCENCKHMNDDSTCGFFKTLNEKLPELFDIDINIDAKGCCNAQQSRET
jgi:hypothetical protein